MNLCAGMCKLSYFSLGSSVSSSSAQHGAVSLAPTNSAIFSPLHGQTQADVLLSASLRCCYDDGSTPTEPHLIPCAGRDTSTSPVQPVDGWPGSHVPSHAAADSGARSAWSSAAAAAGKLTLAKLAPGRLLCQPWLLHEAGCSNPAVRACQAHSAGSTPSCWLPGMFTSLTGRSHACHRASPRPLQGGQA